MRCRVSAVEGSSSAFQEREARLPALLVLCGDHGMSEAGGHGASSTEEVNTALVLISSAFERKPGEDAGRFHVWALRFVSACSHLSP